MKFKQLFNPFIRSRDACEQVWGRAPIVRLPQACHTLLCAPTGAGKGVSVLVPHLLTCNESMVCVDFKGELAKLTARRREKMGHRVALLDPWRQVTQKPATFNPLDGIHRESALAIDDCNDLANALVVRSGHEAEPHWNASAEAFIAAICGAVVAYGRDGSRSLQTVRAILSNPGLLAETTKGMLEAKDWSGLLAQMGGQLLHFAEKEKSSVLSTTLRHLRFLGTLAVAESTESTNFDVRQLRGGKLTIYLIVPAEHMAAQAGLLRMWIASMIRACVREGLQ